MKKHYELDYGKDNSTNPIYLVNGDKKEIVLRASPLDKGWAKPGQVFCTLKDTENGLIFFVNGRAIELDYLEAEMLRLSLKLNNPDVKLLEITKKAVK
jgi:hypothetical protein